MGTPSLQLLSEKLLMRKRDRIYQKRSSTTKDTRKNPQGDRKEGQWGGTVKIHTIEKAVLRGKVIVKQAYLSLLKQGNKSKNKQMRSKET